MFYSAFNYCIWCSINSLDLQNYSISYSSKAIKIIYFFFFFPFEKSFSWFCLPLGYQDSHLSSQGQGAEYLHRLETESMPLEPHMHLFTALSRNSPDHHSIESIHTCLFWVSLSHFHSLCESHTLSLSAHNMYSFVFFLSLFSFTLSFCRRVQFSAAVQQEAGQSAVSSIVPACFAQNTLSALKGEKPKIVHRC